MKLDSSLGSPIVHRHLGCAAERDAERYLEYYARVPVIDLGIVGGTACRVLAICGGAHIDASFKNLLALGMLLLLRRAGLLNPAQTVVESTSGSFGEGLAVAGQILGHPIIVVSDPNLPFLTRRKIELLHAQIDFVSSPHPILGWQQAREDRTRALAASNPDWFWTDQNNSEYNPMTYTNWLVPEVQKQIEPKEIAAAVFGIGSGGHFSALASWLKRNNPHVRTFAAERVGSITFGGRPAPSRLRGIGNQNIVPASCGVTCISWTTSNASTMKRHSGLHVCWRAAASSSADPRAWFMRRRRASPGAFAAETY